jgi:hypothetical protein
MNKLEHLKSIAFSPIYNYAGIPGLTSSLITPATEHGLIRMFHSEREHHEVLIPHSHRYDFRCEVLQGQVDNTIWYEYDRGTEIDMFRITKLEYGKEPGDYKRGIERYAMMQFETSHYGEGDTYSMTSNEIHSIKFRRDTYVLFYEGPKVSDTSVIIEPVVRGKAVPTFKVEDWMFAKEWN